MTFVSYDSPSIKGSGAKSKDQSLKGNTFTYLRKDPGQALRITLICSDDPQHTYLRYLFDQHFPGYQCIIEPNEGQVRHLKNKGRIWDLLYMRYHSRRRKLTGDSRARKAFFSALVPEGYDPSKPVLKVDTVNCPVVWDHLDSTQPEITVCAGTKYIGKKAIARAGMMINLHTGYLPDYKGNQCIFFALYDGAMDKLGATIHQVSPELDGGAILKRVFPPIYPKDSKERIYARCQLMMMDQVVELVYDQLEGKEWRFEQQSGEGRMFRHRDRTPLKELRYWWRRKTGRIKLPNWENR